MGIVDRRSVDVRGLFADTGDVDGNRVVKPLHPARVSALESANGMAETNAIFRCRVADAVNADAANAGDCDKRNEEVQHSDRKVFQMGTRPFHYESPIPCWSDLNGAQRISRETTPGHLFCKQFSGSCDWIILTLNHVHVSIC